MYYPTWCNLTSPKAKSYTRVNECLLWQYPKNKLSAPLILMQLSSSDWSTYDTRTVSFTKTHPHEATKSAGQSRPGVPRTANTHLSPWSTSYSTFPLLCFSKSSPRAGPAESLWAVNSNTCWRYYSSREIQGWQCGGWGCSGKKDMLQISEYFCLSQVNICSKNLGCISVSRSSQTVFCQGPGNNILDFLVKGLCDTLLNFSVVA